MTSIPWQLDSAGPARPRLERGDLLRLKVMVGSLLVLVAVWSLSGLDLARSPLLPLVGLAGLLTLAVPRFIAAIPSQVWLLATPLIIGIAVLDFLISGRDLLPPLVRLLLLLTLYRSLAPRSPREDFQLLAICMILVMISGVFTLSWVFAFQILVFSLLAVGFLLLINLAEGSEEPEERPDWKDFSWSSFARRIFAAWDAWTMALLGLLVFGLILMAGVLFVVIPRFQMDHAIPFFQLPTTARSGFSDTISLGDVTSIMEDNSIALRVDIESPGSIPSSPYWRMLVLDRYRDGRFEVSEVGAQARGREFRQSHFVRVHDDSGFPGEWDRGSLTFYLEGGISKYLPTPGLIGELRFQGRQEMYLNPRLAVYQLRDSISSVFFYQVRQFSFDRFIPGVDWDNELTGVGPLWFVGEDEQAGAMRLRQPLTTLAVPLQLPEDRRYLEGLIDRLANGEDPRADPAAFAERVRRYLEREHRYSLSPGRPSGEGDVIVRWLREGGDGHCEYFAGAFTLLMRSAGIPTRVVVGFLGGSWNDFENYFVVRNRHAHAWNEFFDGERWQRLDATPGNELAAAVGHDEAIARGLVERESDFQAWADSLRILWYRRIVSFDEADQARIASRLTDWWETMGTQLSAFMRNAGERVREWWTRLISLPGANVMVVLAMTLVVVILWLGVRYRDWLSLPSLFIGKKRGYAPGPVRRRASHLLARLEPLAKRREAEPAEMIGLRRIRFGPGNTWPHPAKTFLQSRRLIRRWRREDRRSRTR